MGEKLTGHDILERVPLSELLLPRDEALRVLHDYSIRSARFNFDVLTNYAHQLPLPWPARVRSEVTPEYIEKQIALLPVGGSALLPRDFDTIYDSFSGKPFNRLLRHYLKERIPSLFKQQAHGNRQPGVVAVGMLTDLKRIIRPEIVNPDTVYPFIIKYMRRPGVVNSMVFGPFGLGASLDDTIKLERGTTSLDIIDPRADKLGAIELYKTYLRVATDEEKRMMMAGFNITLEQITQILDLLPMRGPTQLFN